MIEGKLLKKCLNLVEQNLNMLNFQLKSRIIIFISILKQCFFLSVVQINYRQKTNETKHTMSLTHTLLRFPFYFIFNATKSSPPFIKITFEYTDFLNDVHN